MPRTASFEPELLEFLSGLRRHNTKAWFDAHRSDYETYYREAFVRFVAEFGERLPKISRYLVADPRPTGGSVMRIYRDIRFSKDKSPYRTYTVVHFGHRDGGEGTSPGLFLYVDAQEVSAGGGLWHPEPATAKAIRTAIHKDPKGWTAATRTAAFRRKFELTGESLKRVPPGFPPESPLGEDLRRKDYVASSDLTTKQLTSPGFLDTYEGVARSVAPLMRFLCRATGLRY